jgi:hypothetical protein
MKRTNASAPNATAFVRVPITSIRSEIGLQVRSKLDQRTVRDYADKWRTGVKFPPILIFKRREELILIDGHHRCAAAAEAGLTKVDATFLSGTLAQAVCAGIETNARHGLRLSNRDKRASVQLALRHSPDLSDGAIGALCGVSSRMVAKYRGRAPANDSDLKRVGRDGKLYPPKPTLTAHAAGAEHGKGGESPGGSSASGDEERRLSQFADGVIELRRVVRSLIEHFPEFNGVVHRELVALTHCVTPNRFSVPPQTIEMKEVTS